MRALSLLVSERAYRWTAVDALSADADDVTAAAVGAR
jgi:hypothetical protein